MGDSWSDCKTALDSILGIGVMSISWHFNQLIENLRDTNNAENVNKIIGQIPVATLEKLENISILNNPAIAKMVHDVKISASKEADEK